MLRRLACGRVPRELPHHTCHTTPGTCTLIEGHIETVSAEGVVQGWLRDTSLARPCHIQVRHGADTVAEALAQDFRPDLLLAGHGHGHHGFAARLGHALPQGRASLVLHLPHTGLSAPMAVAVPPLTPGALRSVEDLLLVQPGWTAPDLLACASCLDWEAIHAGMGTPRFVDGLFRFVLERWPSAPEARLHGIALAHGRVSPQGLLIELLSGRERADMPPGLISPYDPDFPFPPAAGTPAR